MADTVAANVNNVLDIPESDVLGQDTLIVTEDVIDEAGTGVPGEDMLQQALDEASDTLVVENYPTGDESVTVSDDLVGVETEFVTNDDNGVVTGDVNFDPTQFTVVSGEDGNLYQIEPESTEDLTAVDGSDLSSVVAVDENMEVQPQIIEDLTEKVDISNGNSLLSNEVPIAIQSQSQTQSQPISVRIVTNPNTPAPLGSSQNPIRIIQQGNQYTPVQNLSTEQLTQIMQVVQEQQVTKSATAQGQSILFNPQTNTRIVYRVIYPSELHKKTGNANNNSGDVQSQGQQTTMVLGQPGRRPYKKRKLLEMEDDRYDGPELSKEEKEQKKKQRPRTRSGRVSKPPKHMVKDYKHIHVLDWDEDYDDSDGGYSDFKEEDKDRMDIDEGSLDGHTPGQGIQTVYISTWFEQT